MITFDERFFIGIEFSYFGDICQSTRKQRQFKMVLSCEDKLNPVPLHALEYERCVYTVCIGRFSSSCPCLFMSYLHLDQYSIGIRLSIRMPCK
jgi:hypothetical protein